jgi:transcriptional regulator
VDEVEGSFKLNQHKADADHVAVASALGRLGDAAGRQLAGTMRAMRPNLFDDAARTQPDAALLTGVMR